MKWHQSIKVRIFALFSLFPLFLLVLMFLFWGPVQQVNQSLNDFDVLHENLQNVTDLAEARRAASNAVVAAAVTRTDTTEEYDAHSRTFDDVWSRFVQSRAPQEVKEDVRRLRDLSIEQTGRELLILSKVRAGEFEEAEALLSSDYLTQNEALLSELHHLALNDSAEIVRLSDVSQDKVAQFFTLFIAILV